VAGMGPAGLRRLNKTIYQTEGGAFAYHEVHPRNNVLFGVICFLRSRTDYRSRRCAATEAISSMCTIAAVPMTGIKRFAIGM
jgi:hypothetical protein